MKDDECEEDVRAYLQRNLQGVRCDLLRFPGNYGDALILRGTREILNSAGVEYRLIQCDNAPASDTLIVDGGGNLVDLYDDVRSFLESVGKHYSRIVILPHTITGARPLACLRELGHRVVVFCRERVSYAAVRASAPQAEVFLWHDCALFAKVQRRGGTTAEPNSILFAYRTDAEASSSARSCVRGNRDLSLEGNAMSPLDHIVEVLGRYERVFTDRLHIGIAASLLDCEVVLYPNSYYKNRAVYEYSLVSRKNITFRIDDM